MDNYLALLIFVVPGFISRSVYEKITYNKKKKSDFANTINAMIYNIYILIINLFLLRIYYGMWITVNDIKDKLQYLGFIFWIAVCTLILSVFMAFITDGIKELYFYITNKYRKLAKRNPRVNEKSIFAKTFVDNNAHIISVFKEDKELAFGEMKYSNDVYGEQMEIVIKARDDWKIVKEKLKIENTYCIPDKGVKIIDYNISDLTT